ncbi:ADP-ribosylglycohydrolase family protein [Microbacterium sp. DT81.1]|uniref:ADP-ribosylglycohydrolase family protein n=1 Tax=Microbacterium sp. DT81.1 TaxID=3393413 RepID=UPI003CF8317E
MAGWANVRLLLEEEYRQSAEEGKDHDAIESIRARAASEDDPAALAGLHVELVALPVRPDFPFIEPDDLHAIRSLRGASPGVESAGSRDLPDQLHGAWLGRAVGCALGKPVEAFMSARGELASWQRQRLFLQAISPDEWPIRGYVPAESPAEGLTGSPWCPASSRERIAFMETDDDIRYTVIGQLIVARYGTGFTSADVARTWLDRLSYNWVCTAETQAYRNLVARYDAVRDQDPAFEREDPAAIDWFDVAQTLNPYREWIGAQIRIDSYGYAAPGRPEAAAAMAYADARISHTKNGIYGAMLCAAMIAAAFDSDDIDAVVEAGLAQIPSTSRLHAAIRRTVELCAARGNDFEAFEAIIEDLYREVGGYHPAHTINNAAVVVAALLVGGGDFHRAVTFAVMAGWDTDCNGATVGSIMGALLGARRIPAAWTDPLHDTLRSQIAGYHPIPISECADRSLVLAERDGGAVPWQAWW